ncbi:hypothetical protein B0I72DRAFT_110341 [Yarrowia lipolytica]|uniref:YALI0A20790p n=1 Tax=Yarrowia lipolytica (strain CLIB 122 / E 150) TaxID=284591 RepID=Q6CGA9_YARLI|nr:YALI0A20790p [Yarrowia lipolytica CLIB122]RDW33518.1 hypothetical protein B0I72DRAFT_110341 [Yarrowia lipolytica]CAG84241.1 YALI0A20790p [Yarrowia lipolytica CLIB122]|eukprot:XP_500303.1 YALI0A20790p [Yarrowia lipolytica CLIB122]
MKFSLKKSTTQTPDSPPPEEEETLAEEPTTDPAIRTFSLGDVVLTDVVSCKDELKEVHMGYLNDQCYIVIDNFAPTLLSPKSQYVHIMAGRIKFTISEEMTRMADRAFLVLTETLEPPKKRGIHLNTLQLDEDLSIKPTWRQGRVDLWYEYAASPQAFFKTVKRINELRDIYDTPRTLNVIRDSPRTSTETQDEKENSSGSEPSTFSSDLSLISPATTQEEMFAPQPEMFAPPPDSPLPATPNSDSPIHTPQQIKEQLEQIPERPNSEGTFDFGIMDAEAINKEEEEEEEEEENDVFEYPALFEQCEIIQEALDDPSTCDFVIASESGEVPVHSLILKARWPHFKLICDRDSTIENQQNRSLSLSQHPHTWVKAMVDCIYGVDPHIDDFDTLLKLMMFAEVYQVQQLHEFVNYKISFIKLNPVLMCQLWKAAYTCDNSFLLDRCAAFYTRHVEEVSSCQDLEGLTKPEMAELLRHVRRSKPEFADEQPKYAFSRGQTISLAPITSVGRNSI